jgi:hypothetical protein|nr:MAG TPA: hypothetical protein [Caudoviricetes sp.]
MKKEKDKNVVAENIVYTDTIRSTKADLDIHFEYDVQTNEYTIKVTVSWKTNDDVITYEGSLPHVITILLENKINTRIVNLIIDMFYREFQPQCSEQGYRVYAFNEMLSIVNSTKKHLVSCEVTSRIKNNPFINEQSNEAFEYVMITDYSLFDGLYTDIVKFTHDGHKYEYRGDINTVLEALPKSKLSEDMHEFLSMIVWEHHGRNVSKIALKVYKLLEKQFEVLKLVEGVSND